MAEIEFHFDIRSPYSYLAHTQLAGLGAPVVYRPMDVLALMKQVGNTPTSVECPAKRRYAGTDLARWAGLYGVPFGMHPRMSRIDGRRLLRALVAAGQDGRIAEATAALFAGYWAEQARLETPEEVAAWLAGKGVVLDAARLDDPALDAALDAATVASADQGVFGAPTFIVGEQMYFGNDRLDFLRDHLRTAA